jgi:hypothetical protein
MRPTVDKFPARRFPIQHEIQKLKDQLHAFNERIAELEDEGHRGYAMEVLKANALDFCATDRRTSRLARRTHKERSVSRFCTENWAIRLMWSTLNGSGGDLFTQRIDGRL